MSEFSDELKIGQFSIQGEAVVLADIVVALGGGSRDNLKGQRVIVVGPGLSFNGEASAAVTILEASNLSVAQKPYFDVRNDALKIILPDGRIIDPLTNRTDWVLSQVGLSLGLSAEDLRDGFYKALKERPWQQRNGRKNGNAKKAAEPATTA